MTPGEVCHRVRIKETLLSPDIPEKNIIQIFIGIYSLLSEKTEQKLTGAVTKLDRGL